MNTRLGRIVILVDDYDEAFRFYKDNFSCRVLFDSTNNDGQRFLHIAFSADDQTGIWLLKAENGNKLQKTIIGHQTAGYPTMVIYTDNIKALYEHVGRNHVKIITPLTPLSDNSFFHCEDLYGNKLTVVEMQKPSYDLAF